MGKHNECLKISSLYVLNKRNALNVINAFILCIEKNFYHSNFYLILRIKKRETVKFQS